MTGARTASNLSSTMFKPVKDVFTFHCRLQKFYKIQTMKAIYKILNPIFLSALILINLAFAQANTSVTKHKITLAADYWCPYNCMPEDENPGFLVELARRALKIYGVEIEYILMPWHAALEKVQAGEVDGIIGISNIEGKNLVKTRIPLEYSMTRSYTRADTEWVFDGVESLRGKKLSVVMDYVMEDSINNYVSINFPHFPNWFVIEDGKLAVVESIANLVDGDTDVFIEDERVVEYYIKAQGLNHYIRDAGKINDNKLPIFIALSLNNPSARTYIKYMEDGIAALKATGEYKHLRAKYNIDLNNAPNN